MEGLHEVDSKELTENPKIFSLHLSVHKNSFVDYRQPFDLKCPPPKYFSNEELLKPLPTDKSEILKGMLEMPQGHLVCVD